MKKILRVLCVSFLLIGSIVGFVAPVVHAKPGDLDLSFGDGGIVLTDLSHRGCVMEGAQAVAVQGSPLVGGDKLVVVGTCLRNGGHTNFVVLRYDNDGTPISLDIPTDKLGGARAVAIQPYGDENDPDDDKIVVAGVVWNPNSGDSGNNDFAVARYTSEGNPDYSFGDVGEYFVMTDINGNDMGHAVAIQEDGKIVVVGSADYVPDERSSIGVARYLSDGSPDNSFGDDPNNNYVTVDPAPFIVGQAEAVAIQPYGDENDPDDDKIVVIGRGKDSEDNYVFVVVRYDLDDGGLDTTFGNNGIVTTKIGDFAEGQAGAIQPDGKIVVAGLSLTDNDNYGDFAVARYEELNGGLDNSFGGGAGFVTTDLGDEFDEIQDLVIQPDGKIVVAGHSGNSDEGYRVAAVARYNPDGSLDTDFGDGGFVMTDIGIERDQILGVALQTDGSIVVAGHSGNDSNDGDILVARYLGNEGPCSSVSQIPIDECKVLITLFVSTNGLEWRNMNNPFQPWLGTYTPCDDWFGVTCAEINGTQHVTEIDLHNNNLSGSIPPELDGLTELQSLNLHANQLSGGIPPRLGNLAKLQKLYLGANQLSGSIPPHLGDLGELQNLSLGWTQLSGSIPPELGKLDNLTTLFLYNNPLLSGALPATLTNLTLTAFYFDNTNLCEPPGAEFQDWLSKIGSVQSTGVICPMNITPEVGGTVSSPDDLASAFFPPWAVPEEVYVSIAQLAADSVPPATGGFQLLGSVYDFNAYDAEGNLITEFDPMLTLTFSYDPADLDGLDEGSLEIRYYNVSSGRWESIPSVVDTDAHTVTAQTDHFSLFGVFGIVVPEPATCVLFGLGLIGLFALVRRRRQRRK